MIQEDRQIDIYVAAGVNTMREGVGEVCHIRNVEGKKEPERGKG